MTEYYVTWSMSLRNRRLSQKKYWMDVMLFRSHRGMITSARDAFGVFDTKIKAAFLGYKGKKTICGRKRNFLGTILLHQHQLGAGIVVHEVVHVALHYYRQNRIKVPKAHTVASKSVQGVFTPHDHEEHFCELVELLTKEIYNWLYDNGRHYEIKGPWCST